MKKLQLSLITARNERIAPLLDGIVNVEGVDLLWTNSRPPETFWRQLKFEEFEAFEMSFSSLLIAKARGNDMVAIPVFATRRFMHAALHVHENSGVKKPSDLAGKRIGVTEYQQTAALWLRGVLETDFGVSQYDVEWYMERSEELSHGGATGFRPPEGIKFHRIPEDKSLASMLVRNEIDAGLLIAPRNRERDVIDRSSRLRALHEDWRKVKPLFPDLRKEGKRFFDAHGYIPANHCYAIRGDVYRNYPWLAFNLFSAFVKAKEAWYRQLPDRLPSDLIFGPQYLAETRSMFGDDPFPYGVKSNERMIQTMIDFSFEQRLAPRKLTIEEIFAPSTLDL